MTENTWTPPSEEIQKLFRFDNVASTSQSENAGLTQNDDFVAPFSEDEFAKIPTTLAKAIRRSSVLLIQTETARKAAIETNNELKAIQNLLIRYAKKQLKTAEKTEMEMDVNSKKEKGFRRPCRISDAMCEFIGKPVGSASSRVEVNNAIHDYIRKQGLIDPENSRGIIPDDKLLTILSESANGNVITYFSLQKYIKHHFLKSVK
jgi:chromatin remodeling complex protein RSC6